MLINSKTLVVNRKLYFLLVRKRYIVSVEIFKTPNDYIAFTRSNMAQHDGLVGMARHANKEECISLAMKDLQKLIE
jgi:hypothetical protein